jgi:hypothetical protein
VSVTTANFDQKTRFSVSAATTKPATEGTRRRSPCASSSAISAMSSIDGWRATLKPKPEIPDICGKPLDIGALERHGEYKHLS